MLAPHQFNHGYTPAATHESLFLQHDVYGPHHQSMMLQDHPSLDLQNLGSKKLSNEHFSSSGYNAMSAKDKMADLWSNIIKDQTPGKFPNALELPGIFIESMKPTLQAKGDAMPTQNLFFHRTKYIHSVGAVGKVKFVPAKNTPYSGIFKGADHGLIRFSSAAAPSKSQPLAPGMGLKFLRDGAESANMVAMWSVAGQPGDWNFFSNDFFNHITAPPDGDVALQALGYKFSTGTDYIQQVGLSDFGAIDEQGNAESANNFPFSLRFEPHSDVHTLFPKDLQGDDYMAYVKQLTQVPKNSALYKVYALPKSDLAGGKEQLIGSLVLDGDLVNSKWGDESLFFRHQDMNEDAKIHPEWVPYLAKYSLGGKCPFQKLMQ